MHKENKGKDFTSKQIINRKLKLGEVLDLSLA